MNTKNLALLLALPLSLLAIRPSDAAPPVGTQTPPTAAPPKVVAAPSVKVKKMAKLEVKNAAAVPGEKRNLEATLTTGQAPAAGKSVTFRIEGKNGTTANVAAGSAVTDAAGKAKLLFELPELAQGAYALKASFAGDDETMGANDEGNLGMIKGITKFEMGDLIWGTYKNEPGPKTGSLILKLVRTSDNDALKKPWYVTVNGNRWQVGSTSSSFVMIPLPTAATWNVKCEFEGDAANQATSATRTYTKPNN